MIASFILLCLVQVTASSVGVNPIPVENGPLRVNKAHMMLSTFGITSPTEAGTMTHAHTFANKYARQPISQSTIVNRMVGWRGSYSGK